MNQADTMSPKFLTKTFQYLGFTFTPVCNLTPTQRQDPLSLPLFSIGISNYENINNSLSKKWNFQAFYHIAQAHKAQADIYLLNDTCLVIPCPNELFAFGPDEALKFKGHAEALKEQTFGADVRYKSLYTEINQLMAQLIDKLLIHTKCQAKDNKNWGFVGDLGHLKSLLEEVVTNFKN